LIFYQHWYYIVRLFTLLNYPFFLLLFCSGELASILSKVRSKADENFIAAHKAKHSTINKLNVSLVDIIATPKKQDAKKRCACCLDPRAVSVNPVKPALSTSIGTKLTVDDEENSMVYCGTCDAVTETVDASAMPSAEGEIAQLSATDDSPEIHEAPSPTTLSAPNAHEDSVEDEPAPPMKTTGSVVLCRNFRELLWYWQQYYLRRGRDRLSIEFSAHLPFRYWQALVGECDTFVSHSVILSLVLLKLFPLP